MEKKNSRIDLKIVSKTKVLNKSFENELTFCFLQRRSWGGRCGQLLTTKSTASFCEKVAP